MKKFIVGIDPGRNGGIVGLTNGKINVIDKMPPNPESIWGYFVDVLGIPLMKNNKENIYVFIEDVHSMPTDGVRSAFSFGRRVGELDMVLSYYNLHTIKVLPREWQSHFNVPTRKESGLSKYQHKKYLHTLAGTLLPKDYQNKITLATCDAYLIALYGYHQLKTQSKEKS